MRNTKINDIADRGAAALIAKAALLQNYRASVEAAEPARAARQQEQLEVAAAREKRRQDREQMKAQARAQQEKSARVAAEAAKDEMRRSTDSLIARVVRDDAARKAERDCRYANRKARQR